jgi:hypothetical protein
VQTVKSTRIPQISPFLAMFACALAFSRALFSRIFSTLQTSFDSAPSQNPAPSSRSISCRLRHCLASAWVMKLSDSSASWACLRFFLPCLPPRSLSVQESLQSTTTWSSPCRGTKNAARYFCPVDVCVDEQWYAGVGGGGSS